MEVYLMIIIIVAVLALVGVVFGILNQGAIANLLTRINAIGQLVIVLPSNSTFNGFKDSIQNSINTSISSSTNKSQDIITTALKNQSSMIVAALNSENGNATNNNKGVNKNITVILDNQNNQSKEITTINQTVATLPNEINNIIANDLAMNSQNTIANTISIWKLNQSATTNGFLENQMLDTFNMHMKMNASNAIQLYVMTEAEYANFSVFNTISAVQSYSSSGPYNSISFEFDTSNGCGAYLYVIEGQGGSAFTLYPNVTGTYSPSATLQGACR